jgi:hypothetical protein
MKLSELPKMLNIDNVKIFCQNKLQTEVRTNNCIFTQETFQDNELIRSYLENEIKEMSVSCGGYLHCYKTLEIYLK